VIVFCDGLVSFNANDVPLSFVSHLINHVVFRTCYKLASISNDFSFHFVIGHCVH